MALFGTVSDMVAQSTDNDLLVALDADSYTDKTKKTLLQSIREADIKVTKAKNSYGNGVSVKGIVANVSGFHFLKRTALKADTGKSWSDNDCLEPTTNVSPLAVSAFFHAKSDGAAKGCRAGATYHVLDQNSVIKGIISVAWENPYSGDFVYYVMVSKKDDNLNKCLKHCDDSSKSDVIGDVTITMPNDQLKQFITVNVMADNKSTAYILIGIKTDDFIRQVYGAL